MEEDNIKLDIAEWFEKEYKDVHDAARDFVIQYSFLEKTEEWRSEKECCVEGYEWHLTCFLPYILWCDYLYDINCISYSDDDCTDVLIKSWKGNHDEVELKELVQIEGRTSTNEKIYLLDVYPEHKLRHFKGDCWTRGWTYHLIRDDLTGIFYKFEC